MRAAAKVNLWNDWMLRGVYSTGAVKIGSNRDSDYAGNNRTQEFSRSDNKTGGAVRDISHRPGQEIPSIASFGSWQDDPCRSYGGPVHPPAELDDV